MEDESCNLTNKHKVGIHTNLYCANCEARSDRWLKATRKRICHFNASLLLPLRNNCIGQFTLKLITSKRKRKKKTEVNFLRLNLVLMLFFSIVKVLFRENNVRR